MYNVEQFCKLCSGRVFKVGLSKRVYSMSIDKLFWDENIVQWASFLKSVYQKGSVRNCASFCEENIGERGSWAADKLYPCFLVQGGLRRFLKKEVKTIRFPNAKFKSGYCQLLNDADFKSSRYLLFPQGLSMSSQRTGTWRRTPASNWGPGWSPSTRSRRRTS